MNTEPYLILVDDNDREFGKLEKQLVHELGLLHRAFSIFIFNSVGELLLQQRSETKYHSGGLWTNTCCSHPEYGEGIEYAVSRRLFQEMGLQSDCEYAFSFIYKATLDNGLIEHEYDHVFIGFSDEAPMPCKEEVKDWRFVSIDELQRDVLEHPEFYTAWMKICLDRVANYMQNRILKVA